MPMWMNSCAIKTKNIYMCFTLYLLSHQGMVVVDMEGMAGTRAMAMVVNNSSSMETLEVGCHVA